MKSGSKEAELKKIKIIIVDDHAIVRHGICQALITEPNFEIVADIGCGKEAIDLALLHRPDVIIMDISMPDFNGIEATKEIITNNPNIKVIALSMHVEKIYVMGMLNAGASGYILKSDSMSLFYMKHHSPNGHSASLALPFL
ncbi:MAG: response regulator transcription factor [Desulfobacula sp.]|jgi:DNA-binding NarL/FixJ family response regulator|nr:response regulator transcription factor [Desulfobacula sp.]MBT3486476.1 response regulator transcription factor [Desulfobacula sp.]MBT3806787.1 response regulator transcription factor [Desulfobacula sp.]MBT4027082.1 response regulator transcription factor [Desulfobacula sp.]MBT4197882.1 response regulator transcription factor [Desulfobacula sp.]